MLKFTILWEKLWWYKIAYEIFFRYVKAFIEIFTFVQLFYSKFVLDE